MRRCLPPLLILAALTAACTPQELEALGRVLIEASTAPVPVAGGASPSPAASTGPAAKPGTTPSPVATTAATAWSADERELHRLLTAYRAEKGLPEIPLSVSLTKVARAHVADLLAHPPDGETCNMHSWSKNGPWTAGCYTDDHALAKVMWDKPRELTTYPGNGYEIAYGA